MGRAATAMPSPGPDVAAKGTVYVEHKRQLLPSKWVSHSLILRKNGNFSLEASGQAASEDGAVNAQYSALEVLCTLSSTHPAHFCLLLPTGRQLTLKPSMIEDRRKWVDALNSAKQRLQNQVAAHTHNVIRQQKTCGTLSESQLCDSVIKPIRIEIARGSDSLLRKKLLTIRAHLSLNQFLSACATKLGTQVEPTSAFLITGSEIDEPADLRDGDSVLLYFPADKAQQAISASLSSGAAVAFIPGLGWTQRITVAEKEVQTDIEGRTSTTALPKSQAPAQTTTIRNATVSTQMAAAVHVTETARLVRGKQPSLPSDGVHCVPKPPAAAHEAGGWKGSTTTTLALRLGQSSTAVVSSSESRSEGPSEQDWGETEKFHRFRTSVASTSALASSAASKASSASHAVADVELNDEEIAKYAKSGAARAIPLLLCLRWQADPREVLLHMGIVSAIREPNLYATADVSRAALVRQCLRIVAPKGGYAGDPEFLFKVATYLRSDMHVRSVPNFLLAVAAHLKPCKHLLAKYFPLVVRHPGDLLELVNFYYTIPNRTMNERSLPRSLRRCIAEKFNTFDEYQLAKYGSEAKRKAEARKKKKTALKEGNSVSTAGNALDVHNYLMDDNDDAWMPPPEATIRVDLRTLVRSLHLSGGKCRGGGKKRGSSDTSLDESTAATKVNWAAKGRLLVMKLLRLRYPDSEDSFQDSGLPGRFNPELAGKRLTLSTPRTWEVDLSMARQRSEMPADVWTRLVLSHRLPALALIRNIRNIICSGVPYEVHKTIWKTVVSPRFLGAGITPSRLQICYRMLDELPQTFKSIEARHCGKVARLRMKLRRGHKSGALSLSEKLKLLPRPVLPSEIANVPLVRGRTIVLVDMGKALGSQGRAAAALLASIIYLRTEKRPPIIKAFGVGGGKQPRKGMGPVEWGTESVPCIVDVEFAVQKSILANAEAMVTNLYPLSGGTSFPFDYLMELADNRVIVDNIIHLGVSLKSPKIQNAQESSILDAVEVVRSKTNSRLRFVSVDLQGSAPPSQTKNPLDIFLTGRDEAVLRAIAAIVGGPVNEVDSSGPQHLLDYVQRIDDSKGLRDKAVDSDCDNAEEQMDTPRDFICPITRCLLRDPVIAPDGFTYEREAIAMWLLRSRLSPSTGQDMGVNNSKSGLLLNALKVLRPDHRRKSLIEKWKASAKKKLHAGVLEAVLCESGKSISAIIKREINSIEKTITAKLDPGNAQAVEKQLGSISSMLESLSKKSGDSSANMSDEDRSLLVSSIAGELKGMSKESSQEAILNKMATMEESLKSFSQKMSSISDAVHTLATAIESADIVFAADFSEAHEPSGSSPVDEGFVSVLTSVDRLEDREVQSCRLRLGRKRKLEITIVKDGKGDFSLTRITNIAVTGIDAVQHTTTLPLAEPLPLPVVASLPHREPNAFSFAVDASGLDDGVVEHLCRLRGECFHNGGIGAAVKEGTLVRLDLVVEAEVQGLESAVILRPSIYARVYGKDRKFVLGEALARAKKAWNRLPPFAQKIIKKGVVVAVKAAVKAAFA